MSKTRSAPVAAPTRKHLARAAREARQRRYIVIGTVVVAALVVLVVGFGVFDQTVLRPRQAVARVGDHNITRGEFVKAARFQRLQMVLQYSQLAQTAQLFGNDPQSQQYFQQQLDQISSQLSDLNTLGRNVLTSLQNDQLIRNEAARRGITVSADELDKAYQDLHKRVTATRMWASVYDTACLVLPNYASRATGKERTAANELLAQLRRFAYPQEEPANAG